MSEEEAEEGLTTGTVGQSIDVSDGGANSPLATDLAADRYIDDKIRVFFIETKTFKSSSQSAPSIGRQPKAMQMAFTSMKTYKFDANWIKEEEVVLNPWANGFRNCLFISDSFDGKAFEYLRSKKARIISPLVILYCYSSECLNRFKSIPDKPYPLFSQCMRKLFVSISGFEGHRKRELIGRIEKMGGNYSRDYTKRVSHLVSDSVRTKKYRVAKQCGSAVVSSHWVDDCWNIYQHNYSGAGEEPIVDKYRLKLFNKLLITVSQVDLPERNQITDIVNNNGGVYSPSLKLNANNCLLLLKEPSGEKYKYAKMKHIPCLDVQWLYDSVAKGFTQCEDNYVIGSKCQSSAQKSAQRTPNTSKQLHKLDSNILNHTFESRSDTITTTITSVPNTDNICLSGDANTEDIAKRIDGLSTYRTSDEPFLEGCDVFVVGFKRPDFEVIKSALISSGSMVYNDFKDMITHVIVGPNVDESEIHDMCDNKSCKLVTIEWLFQCLKQNECYDCTQYEIKRPKSDIRSNGSQNKRRKTEHMFDGPLTVVSTQAMKRGSAHEKSSKFNSKYNHLSIGVGLGLNDPMDVQWDDSSSQ
ncbi:unnamed protein product [Medioppia subpectinata]|uniref:BRCT domain-containing protein n=1 Tax=Medioppia subpectinata TaxID=1979941 RepID=A0A7R9PYN8_9ACAR|nr:unnamed protein product [Medioppia subpectinata]CAG2106268.1 unnamed protein product [Medioppia subpectinata]